MSSLPTAHRPAANAASTRGANRGPSKGSHVSPAQGPPALAFPPALPARIARLIDGVNVVSVDVSYTKYGTVTNVVCGDGSIVPLEQYEASAKAQAAARVFERERKTYLKRIQERCLEEPAPAKAIDVVDHASFQLWLEAWKLSDPESFKILSMSARIFRAQQGANVVGTANNQ